jgi:hypothetical protein
MTRSCSDKLKTVDTQKSARAETVRGDDKFFTRRRLPAARLYNKKRLHLAMQPEKNGSAGYGNPALPVSRQAYM